MSNEQTFRGESIGLNIDIRSGDTLEETRLSNIGITANEERSGIGVNRRETTKMLADLIEVKKGILQSLADGGHSTQPRALQLLALEKRLRIFEQTDIISGHNLYQMFRCR